MPGYMEEKKVNTKAYEEQREKLRQEYSGKYVIIAHGKVCGIADTAKEAQEMYPKVAPNAWHCLIFNVDDEQLVDEDFFFSTPWISDVEG